MVVSLRTVHRPMKYMKLKKADSVATMYDHSEKQEAEARKKLEIEYKKSRAGRY